MRKIVWLALIASATFFKSFGEGSKNLTPSNTGTATGTNTFVGYLEHDWVGFSGDFLDPAAGDDEKMYVYIKDGETLYWGLRRVTNGSEDLTVALFENGDDPAADTPVGTWTLTSTGVTLDAGAGVIASYAEASAGPSAVVGAGGYSAQSYTNNTGTDQDFFIVFVQADGGPNATYSNDIDDRSWYDLWDFSVYNGSEEKPGRLHCKRWNFSTGAFNYLLSTEFQMYARIPSTIGGQNVGSYIKEIDLSGIDPFSVFVYANSTGADAAAVGSSDFRVLRQSRAGDDALIEYDLFINNPDIEIYPTSVLPTVTITDANFFCNDAGTGGEAVITIESNQVGQVAVIVDLDGTNGYQDGTEDVIIEAEVGAEGFATIRWDGLDGLGATVATGSNLTISGRFTAGPLHIPLYDVEDNVAGIKMLDVRPATSFDLIFWDDSNVTTNQTPTVELDGSNTNNHNWTGTDGDLHNTWSFGYYQINTQNITFDYVCDADGDGVPVGSDLDNDNDGIPDTAEGDYLNDADGDDIPDYLDEDVAGYVDSNNDGINDNFDQDLDGVIDAIDVDSDNDGISDLVENGIADPDNDGTLDNGSGITDINSNGLADEYDSDPLVVTTTFPDECLTVADPTHNLSFTVPTDDAAGDATLTFTLVGDYGTQGGENFTLTGEGAVDLGTYDYTDSDNLDGSDCNVLNYSITITQANWNTFNDDGTVTITMTTGGGVDAICTGNSSCISNMEITYNVDNPGAGPLTLIDTDSDGVANYLDMDGDNDGIVDAIEVGQNVDANGQIASFTDANGNGLNDAQELSPVTLLDSDADGSLYNYLDIDSDNDGISDNVEAQASTGYIAPVAGDTNGNGLLDVYDPNNGGTLLTTVDTDSDGDEDYFDTDSDGDGVLDIIEGHDADFNGFGDWDATGSNNDISDETGYNTDTDSDGLWDVFDTDNGGTAAVVQNTDGAGLSDWQDTDDDNDGKLTSGEDINTNGDWTDDKTEGQGGGGTPDYLYRGDLDGDAIADANDADSDNDGILDSTEDNGETIDPSGDEDGDSVPNYRDTDDGTVTAGLSSTADSNGDNIYDVFDSDLDGVPDFLDLDSDNDGLWDAIEANGGAVPFGLDETSGRFNLQDPDNDGLMNYVDSDAVSAGGTSTLANPDSDSDGVSDYIDIDSDRDGIVDLIEFQTVAAYIAPSNIDTDGDGIDDSFDPDNGGTLLSPVNTDGVGLFDYLDDDSDEDGVPDIIEGDDADFDGYGDWDLTGSNNDITDETGYGTDTDGDGLDDIFDTVTLGSGSNVTGSNTDIQNTDGTDLKDWRDNNDDNDTALTSAEDTNTNNDWTDDFTNGQAAMTVPDYLFNGDFDGDGIADTADLDSDNDGILDTDEDNGETINPSGDEDGDGIPNFRDFSDAAVTAGLSSTADANGDGVYDVFDSDRDGLPDFKDLDSDNDGIQDILEAGGVDADSDGVLDGYADSDNDGILDAYDVDSTLGADVDLDGIDDAFDFSVSGGTDTDGDDIIDSADRDDDGDGYLDLVDPDEGGTAFTITDTDGDGRIDSADLDSDNDGLPDIVEVGGTDSNNDGKLDDLTDTDADGLADTIDSDQGGSSFTLSDTDNDGSLDYKDLDSDNDGITDSVESRLADTDGDGLIDNVTDTDGDGWADLVDSDNGGTAAGAPDDDNDGLLNHQDLDANNDGYPDILAAGGTDADDDGVVDNTLDADDDGIPDNVDISYFAINGGSGTDTDGDGIDDTFDVDQTGGNDTDGDSIDNTFDSDADGNGFDDFIEANPYLNIDSDGDGNPDSHDLDSDNDGITNATEYGITVDPGTGQIASFTDANSNGWNDAQESTPLTLPDTDNDPFNIPDYLDLDSDDDGIVDNYEGQNKSSYIAPSGIDSDNDGLDDAYDPDNGGTLLTPPNTDGTGDEDYIDTDSDDDGINDSVEGANSDKNQYADWDSDNDNDPTDETGWDADVDEDGIFDLFDNVSGTGMTNVLGSTSAVQDTDIDDIWDFQDDDDDNDGALTSAENSTAVADPEGIIPDYLYGDQDSDGDGIGNDYDIDFDNDGMANVDEDGGTGIDPSGDIDSDGLLNYQDSDMDGDGTANVLDSDGDGSGTNTTTFVDSNADGVIDLFDKDLDGIADFVDLDSDNDGILDLVEFGETDSDNDGVVDGFTDVSGGTFRYLLSSDCSTTFETFNSGSDTAGPTNDDEEITGTLPFSFDFYQTTFNGTNFSLNSNGWFSFDAITPGGAYDEVTLPDGTYTNTIFINAGDLDPSQGGTITYRTNGVAPNRVFSVTFDNVSSFSGTGSGNFQLQLHETTNEIRVLTTFFDHDDARINTQGLSQDGTTFYAFPNRNGVGYTITTAECRSFIPSLANGRDDTIDGAPLSTVDTDSDGVDNYLDLDSDNDGITDNREAQTDAGYIAPIAGDTDANGILDVYEGAGAITPINSDGTDVADYLDSDSDNDGIADIIEGWDADIDGYADWDTNGNNVATDETSYDSDADNDGIWFLFDSNNGLGSIANIDGSNQVLSDQDGDGTLNYRDTDDDGDGILTSAEDDSDGGGGGADGDWTNDFSQGGGTIPNFLYAPDSDGDGILDDVDADADNDGVPDTDEFNGATYATVSDDPFDDDDADNIYNYLDSDATNFVDVNSDGVDDRVDQDFDGVPNFFDTDSDNDGILDGVEANNGVVHASFVLNTGRFTGADTDNDGLLDPLDSDNGGTALANEDFDADGIDDVFDLDSDQDGLTDNIEGQSTGAFAAPTGTDTDGDGVDDSYDNDNSGTPITPENTDGTDEVDYRDTDSDNDTNNPGVDIVGDAIEGFDANKNGFSDLDLDQDGDLSDESGYNTDTDGDGLWDIFDNYSGYGVNNITGDKANLQDTDGDGTLDFRDTDDDEDFITTAVEDVNGNGIWTDDKIQGGGATPDYLYFNDSDNDRVADGQDVDGDQDGVLNIDEYSDFTAIDPFGDADADGVYNYNDTDNPGTLVDSNLDGIWDEYDTDLDGVPNFFDLDSDNDGIPDLVENGGTDADNDGKLDGLTDTDGDGLLDTYDVDQTLGVDANFDGIDDSFQDGPDNDSDGIEDTADRDDDNDGIVDIIDDSGEIGVTGTPLTIGDFDSDGVDNMFDLDSDNDGLVDLVEAGGSDTNGDGVLDSAGDTDGDGWGNSFDSDNGGTALTIPNTDTTDDEDYLDLDADGDGTLDYLEGFDDDEDGSAQNDYQARALAYGNASHYNPLDLIWFTNDADADNWPDFLDPDLARFIDSDGDGLINLFDLDQGGDFYGNVSGIPDNDGDGEENFLDKDGDFVVSPTSITTDEDGAFETFNVSLNLQPISDVVINVTASSNGDEISLSHSSVTLGTGNWSSGVDVTVTGQNDFLNDGDEDFEITLSVNDPTSDDDYDDAQDQTVYGTNEDNEGAIRVSSSTVTSTEGGSNVTFSVELTVAPTTNVVIDLTESSDEGSISPTQLTFTNGDWDTPQDVTITPADDADLDGDQNYNITLSVNDLASDDNFDPADDEIVVVTNEDDEEGIVISTTSVTTSETGTTGNFTIVLDVMPTNPVNLTISESSDEGSVSPTNISFTSGTYNVAQPITITPADDGDADGNQVYSITISVDGGSDAGFLALGPYTVNVTNEDDESTPLPLDFVSFEGEYIDEAVELEWVTENEINVSHFEIQHSRDGENFDVIGEETAVNIASTVNTYYFTHTNPDKGNNYYRLLEIDFDGYSEYSDIIKVSSPLNDLSFNLHPNPTNGRVVLTFGDQMEDVRVLLVDISGVVVVDEMFEDLNRSELELDASGLSKGIYYVFINTLDRKESLKLIKK